MGRIEARCGEEDKPEVLEGANMESEDGGHEKGKDDVARPDAAKGELAFGRGFDLGFQRLRVRFEVIRLSRATGRI